MRFFQTVAKGYQGEVLPWEAHDHARARLRGQEDALNIACPENRREPRGLKSIGAIEFKSFELVSILMGPTRGTFMITSYLGSRAPAATVSRLRTIDQPCECALEAGDLTALHAVGCQGRQHGIGSVTDDASDPPDECAGFQRNAGVSLECETYSGDMHTCAPGDIFLGWAFFPTQLIE